MLHKDYLEEALKKFVSSITLPLTRAWKEGDLSLLGDVDGAIGELLNLSLGVVQTLAPQSLVTMMELSGIGADVSHEIAFVLRKEALLYDRCDADDACCDALDKAEAIEHAFNCDGTQPPYRFHALNDALN